MMYRQKIPEILRNLKKKDFYLLIYYQHICVIVFICKG